jgi:hypothetical protein
MDWLMSSGMGLPMANLMLRAMGTLKDSRWQMVISLEMLMDSAMRMQMDLEFQKKSTHHYWLCHLNYSQHTMLRHLLH